MSDMKCPFCQQELEVMVGLSNAVLGCHKCKHIATIGVWQELIRTRKVLDVAVGELKEIDELLSSNKFDVKEAPLLNITQTKISMLLKCITIKQKNKD